jgi:5-deoxy-glucuronate isomerase
MPVDASRLHVRAEAAGGGADPLVLTPERCGWEFAGLRVVRLGAGERRRIVTAGDELAVVPLAGGCAVEVEGRRIALAGRTSVFDRVTDVVYLPSETEAEIVADASCELALPSAPARRRRDVAYVDARDVAVEVRGAGRSTRQVTNFLTPEVDIPDRLSCCEVLTPPGNWSSYPPHKHDDASNGVEAELEEIYYFRVEGPNGMAAHRTYDLGKGWDVTVTVADGDAFLVPRGFHGPCMASPDHGLWYLNVLAGPGEVRSMAISDDPAHAWIRGTWAGQTGDARVPMTTAQGRRS